MLLWEPLYHGAGAQVVLAACMERVTLAMTGRFSASRFWDQACRFKATKIHYIGGILPMLLKQPESPAETRHQVAIACGDGCPTEVWRDFEERFRVRIREGYGLTEVANFIAINCGGPVGSIGPSFPYFEIRIVDDEGRDVPQGETDQIVARGRVPGNGRSPIWPKPTGERWKRFWGELDGTDFVLLPRIPSQRSSSVNTPVGMRYPVHTSSSGLAILAFLPQDEADAILDRMVIQPRTPHTVRDREALQAMLAEVREAGYCITEQFYARGAISVSAPVFDASNRPIAAVNISTFLARHPRRSVEAELAPVVLETAHMISNVLGASRQLPLSIEAG